MAANGTTAAITGITLAGAWSLTGSATAQGDEYYFKVTSANAAWLSSSNWNLSSPSSTTLLFPGVTSNSALGNGTTGDIADFGFTADAATVGIRLDSNAVNLSVGAIQQLGTATNAVTIGQSLAAGQGNLILNGATVNGTPNVILANFSGTYGLTIAPNISSGSNMNLSLASPVSYVIGNGPISITTNIFQASGVTASIVKQGTGTLSLSGTASTFAGGLNVSGGTVAFFNGAALGPTPASANPTYLTLDGGAISYTSTGFTYTQSAKDGVTLGAGGGTINVASANANVFYEVDGVITGSGMLTKTGPGLLVLDATNTYAGGTLISAGTVAVNTYKSLGSSAGTTNVSGGTLLFTGGINFPSTQLLSIGAPGGTLSNNASNGVFLNGVISGSGVLTKTGTGQIYLDNSGNTKSGAIDVAAGTLGFGSNGCWGPTGTAIQTTIEPGGTVVLNGAQFPGTPNTALSSTRSFALNGSGGQIAVNSGENWTISGVVKDGATPGTLTTGDAGSLTLSGNANTYSGGTNISSGTVFSNNTKASGLGNTANSATGTGPVTINNGGTLAGSGSVAGAVTINAGGTIAAGSTATAIGTLTTGIQTWAGGTYLVKFGPNAVPTGGTPGSSGTPGTDNDLLVLDGLSTASTGLTISTNASSPLLTGLPYSFVIAEIPQSAKSSGLTFTAIAPLLTLDAASQSVYPSAVFTDTTDASGDDLLVLSFTAGAPEPTSLLLAGLAVAPLALGRRRRARSIV